MLILKKLPFCTPLLNVSVASQMSSGTAWISGTNTCLSKLNLTGDTSQHIMSRAVQPGYTTVVLAIENFFAISGTTMPSQYTKSGKRSSGTGLTVRLALPLLGQEQYYRPDYHDQLVPIL
jgi:hypothetical protein